MAGIRPVVVLAALLLFREAPALAATGTRLRITFQPDCLRQASEMCSPLGKGKRLDLGPQIAVWMESARGDQFVDTLMVTNLVATFGIGNRPGYSFLPSGPKFPYGKRPMALPVWAHRHGRLYDTVVNQGGVERESAIGNLEMFSSPEPYFCRPMLPEEVVDAVTCPSPVFSSVKGRLYDAARELAPENLGPDGKPLATVPPAKTYFPPRNDLRQFALPDCDDASDMAGCPIAAQRFSTINDLDAVSAATPPYGRPFTLNWVVPGDLADGDYAVFVEIAKEFDGNTAHQHATVKDPSLEDYGLVGAFGQPSVVFKVPFTLARGQTRQAAATEIAGYGDWDGASGALHPPDSTISDSPGSGRGRLLVITQGAMQGRVHVSAEPYEVAPTPDAGADASVPVDASAADASAVDASICGAQGSPAAAVSNLALTATGLGAEQAELSFLEPDAPVWPRVSDYEVRYWNGDEQGDAAFAQGTAAQAVSPGRPAAGVTIRLDNLKAQSRYTVGVRPRGACLDARIAYIGFTTVKRTFTQLSGCFIATAAWGSPSDPAVAQLRRARDWAVARSSLAGAVAAIYARSSPPLARVIAGDDRVRAAVRRLLAPLLIAR
jgi:hypothetical protein